MRMHDGEVHIDADLVRALLTSQFPRLAGLPIRHVRSTGTVNAIYRLGDELCVRLPRVSAWAQDLQKELRLLPDLAARLTLRVPEPVGTGEPNDSYPFSWAIYRWIEGRPYADELVVDERVAARDLAGFVLELRGTPVPDGGPRGGRPPLRELDVSARAAIDASRGMLDAEATAAAWHRALESPPWEGQPVWVHADLLRPNILVHDGRICAVIDFGGVGVGDPAADVTAAWSVFGPGGRGVFRRLLDVDEATWQRARGYALVQAAWVIPYYRRTNPGFVALAVRTVEQILAG